ncbi:ribosome silencing factor [Loigolactobacillus bifermentans]|uniref:Ribosomal silencing factor RsfS n=1 Tax=Loigolactobacillus bifermentans DSM 20003 TaxID=1423726 RepID=A0A0R1H0I9_9LACO|nr:ribosome silencing factor [Loigolactobacillus bifermentans]KRK40000.1 Iojap family protein [Loigolactobacillus bifermentans DSM 20003]QGG59697.1 ribosome silencing factor [Loigolactobacillus bifermentans]
MDSQEILKIAVQAADEKRAEEITALDVREVSLLADYFVVLQAASKRQMDAILDNILEKEELAGVIAKHVEGKNSGKWILIDLGDVVVNVFNPEERAYYNLEKLWSDAKNVQIADWIDA